jgi:S-adenosylhomocysteine hydrolase
MQFGEGVIFILTREDIVNLAGESGHPKDIVDERFIEAIRGGIADLVSIEIKKYMREITK